MTRLLAALLAAAVLAAGCGGGDPEPGADEAAAPSPGRELADKPVVTVPEGAPPRELRVSTLVEGSGEVAAAGDTVTVHYVGKAWSTGREFDASWDRGQPFVFTLGGGEVIRGWDRGVEGMAVGETRLLVIPPELGYGETGAGDAIGPGETLLFAVTLLGIADR